MRKVKKNQGREEPRKPKLRRARCRKVLAILNNRLETLDLLREEEYDPVGDFQEGSIQLAVVRFRDLDVHVSLDTVVFLK